MVDFAHTHKVVVVQDAAHLLLTFDGPPLSFHQVDGAREVCVEINSMSKGFNMIGWRQLCAGHPKIVQARRQGQQRFRPIHGHPASNRQPWTIPRSAKRTREKYLRRLQKLVAALNKVGFTAKMPGGTYFLYVKAPKGMGERTFANAEEASQFLIHEQSVICVPWDNAGAYLQLSVTYLAKDEKKKMLMEETGRRWDGWRCVFKPG